MDSDLPLYKTTLDLSYYNCAEKIILLTNAESYTKKVTWSILLIPCALRGSGAMGIREWEGKER